MKILRVEIENLNSLRGKHCIDFEGPPLGEAGLFAITGPTGAGKSTLLDAITLALFGRAARYGNERNPEGMMSRQTGGCSAAVFFEVRHGERYTATWELRRARGKEDGKIQPARRFIYNADGIPIAESITEAESRIVELVGLDYDRFLRSVMLAQGEFARFLKATADEQAQLLESLTATSIYSELGRLCYREGKDREDALAAREAAANRVSLLSPEEREEKVQGLAAAQARQVAEDERERAMREAVAKALQLAQALQKIDGLERRLREVEAAREAAGDDLGRLALHEQTGAYVEELRIYDGCRKRLREERQAASRAMELATQAEVRWWTGLTAAAAWCRQDVHQAVAEVTAGEGALQSLTHERDERELWLKSHGVDATLGEALPSLSKGIVELTTARREKLRSIQNVQRIQGQRPALEAALTQAGAALSAAEERYTVRQSERDAEGARLRELLAEGDEGKIEDERENCQRHLNGIAKLKEWVEETGKRERKLATLTARLAEFEPQLASADQQEASVRQELAAAELARRRCEDHYEKAKQIASLEQHRAALRPDEMCPLCGSTEHPFLDHGTGDFTPTQLSRDVAAAKTLERAKVQALAEASKAVALLQEKQKACRASCTDEENALLAQREGIRKLAEKLRLTEATGVTLIEREAQLNELARGMRERLERIRAARGALERAEKVLNACDKEVAAARNGCEKATQALDNQQKRLMEEELAGAQWQERSAAAGERLGQQLEPFGVGIPAPGEEEALEQMLRQRAQSYREMSDAEQRCRAQIAQKGESLKHARERLDQALEREGRLGRQVAEAQVDCRRVDEGEATAQRRNWSAAAEMEEALSELREGDKVAKASRRMADVALETADTAFGECRDSLTKRLETSPFADIEALTAARLDLAEVARVQALKEKLRSQQDQLTGERASLQQSIDELRLEGVAEGEAVVELRGALEVIVAENKARLEQIFALRSALSSDDEQRRQHAAELAAVAADREQLKVWKHLQALIGSADGKRFREFAQGISLDILVRHANLHLRRLSQRYLIRRSTEEVLDLRIEDLYQAGMARTMSSLSGGESFLVSLALALGLADLAGRNVRIDSLFIDEGFGSLDSQTVDIAIAALEALQQESKTIGVISHVELLKERIATQIQVVKLSGSASRLHVTG